MISQTPLSHGGNSHAGERTAAATERMTGAMDDAIQSGRRSVDHALDQASSGLQRARDRVAPMVSQLAGQAESLARRSMDAVRDTGYEVRHRAARARDRAGEMTDRTAGYVRDEPLKAILIAAAAGAAVMALVSLLGSRSRHHDDYY